MTHFYRIKEICINLGITERTLRRKIEKGELPALERPNIINTRKSGYSEATYKKIVADLMRNEGIACA